MWFPASRPSARSARAQYASQTGEYTIENKPSTASTGVSLEPLGACVYAAGRNGIAVVGGHFDALLR